MGYIDFWTGPEGKPSSGSTIVKHKERSYWLVQGIFVWGNHCFLTTEGHSHNASPTLLGPHCDLKMHIRPWWTASEIRNTVCSQELVLSNKVLVFNKQLWKLIFFCPNKQPEFKLVKSTPKFGKADLSEHWEGLPYSFLSLSFPIFTSIPSPASA